MAEQKATEGLLFIYLEVGPDVKEADLNGELGTLRVTEHLLSPAHLQIGTTTSTPRSD